MFKIKLKKRVYPPIPGLKDCIGINEPFIYKKQSDIIYYIKEVSGDKVCLTWTGASTGNCLYSIKNLRKEWGSYKKLS